jgi:tRNA dimethylallyltransferase
MWRFAETPYNYPVSRTFYIVGPTAAGKSDLAADVAVRLNAEIVNADAFQIYEGFDLLSGKPEPSTLGKVPHHLIGTISTTEEMSAARYRNMALSIIDDIRGRGKMPLVVGGSGLYLKALTHGLADMPGADPKLRKELNELSTEDLRDRLTTLDPVTAKSIDRKNRRRLVRAIEIALTTGQPASAQRTQWEGGAREEQTKSGHLPIAGISRGRGSGDRRSLVGGSTSEPGARDYDGVFVFRDRGDLYQRINSRVKAMLGNGAIKEVREAGEISPTVEQMIGVKDIGQHSRGEISLAECIARIQQATRRYAKRQLTWFRRQTNFKPLNLSLLSHNEAVHWVLRQAIVGRTVND